MTEEAKNIIEEREEKRKVARENIAAFEQLAKNGVDINNHEAYLDAKEYINQLEEDALNNSQANYGDDKSLEDLENELAEIKSGLGSDLEKIKKCDIAIRKVNAQIEKIKKEKELVTLTAAREIYDNTLNNLYFKLQEIKMAKAFMQDKVKSYTGTSVNASKSIVKDGIVDASTDFGADIAENEYAIAKKRAKNNVVEVKEQLANIDRVLSFMASEELKAKKAELEETLERYNRVFGIEISSPVESVQDDEKPAAKDDVKKSDEETITLTNEKEEKQQTELEKLNEAFETVTEEAKKGDARNSSEPATLEDIKESFRDAGDAEDKGSIFDGVEQEHKPTMIKKISDNIAKGIRNNKVKMAVKALAGVGVATGVILAIPAAWPITMPIAAYLAYDAYKKGARA